MFVVRSAVKKQNKNAVTLFATKRLGDFQGKHLMFVVI